MGIYHHVFVCSITFHKNVVFLLKNVMFCDGLDVVKENGHFQIDNVFLSEEHRLSGTSFLPNPRTVLKKKHVFLLILFLMLQECCHWNRDCPKNPTFFKHFGTTTIHWKKTSDMGRASNVYSHVESSTWIYNQTTPIVFFLISTENVCTCAIHQQSTRGVIMYLSSRCFSTLLRSKGTAGVPYADQEIRCNYDMWNCFVHVCSIQWKWSNPNRSTPCWHLQFPPCSTRR